MWSSVSAVSRRRFPSLHRNSVSVAVSGVSGFHYEEVAENTPKPGLAIPSQDVIGNLSETYLAAAHQRSTSASGMVKREITDLLRAKKYDSLLSVLLKMTGPKSKVKWRDTLAPEELAYVMKHIVHHQIGLATQMGTHIVARDNALGPRIDAHEMRTKIRALYGNLLERSFLYTRTANVSEVRLTARDYENLVALELYNGKLDLASTWFRHMEATYPHGSHYRHMTQRLWVLKMQVYGGAFPPLWKVAPTALYEQEINPRRLRFRAEMRWLDVINDYMTNQHLLLRSRAVVLDSELVSTMMAAMAYSGHVNQVQKLIEQNWGITTNGNMVPNFVLPKRGDPLYPDLDTLRTVAVCMLYNRQFGASMAYLNAFQQHYALDLAHSRNMWDVLFRWSEVTTRFSDERAFQRFLKETAPRLAASATLEQAKESPDFDYEGYLEYLSGLASQRRRLVAELWRGYLECLPAFSVRPFATYLEVLLERALDLPEPLYDVLGELRRQHHLHSVLATSYNARAPSKTLLHIRKLYMRGMRVLLANRASAGHVGQMEYVVDKWALDEAMAAKLREYADRQAQSVAQKEAECEVNADREDEDFLGLI